MKLFFEEFSSYFFPISSVLSPYMYYLQFSLYFLPLIHTYFPGCYFKPAQANRYRNIVKKFNLRCNFIQIPKLYIEILQYVSVNNFKARHPIVFFSINFINVIKYSLTRRFIKHFMNLQPSATCLVHCIMCMCVYIYIYIYTLS